MLKLATQKVKAFLVTSIGGAAAFLFAFSPVGSFFLVSGIILLVIALMVFIFILIKMVIYNELVFDRLLRLIGELRKDKKH